MFDGLQLVVKTVLNAIPDMANVMILLILLMFIWAVLGVTLFGPVVPDLFGSLSKGTSRLSGVAETHDIAMFSMFIVTTQDGWVNMVNALRVCI